MVRARDRSASADHVVAGEVKLWDLVLRRPIMEWAASSDGMLQIHEHAGGRELLTQARDGRVKLWDMGRLSTGAAPGEALVRSLHTDAFHFTRCAVAERGCALARPLVDETHAASGDDEREKAPDGSRASSGLAALLKAHAEEEAPVEEEDSLPGPNPVFDAEDVAAYLVLAPAESAEAMTLWDSRASSCAQELALGETKARNVGMCLSAKLWLPSADPSSRPPIALLGYENGDIIAWDLRMMLPRVHARSNFFKSPVMGLDLAHDGQRIFAAGVEPKARSCKLDASGRILPRGPPLPVTCEATEHAKDGVGELALRPDGKLFATGGWDYRIRLFSAKPPNFKPLAVLRYHDASVNALAFSPDSALLAAGSKDYKISLWSVYAPT